MLHIQSVMLPRGMGGGNYLSRNRVRRMKPLYRTKIVNIEYARIQTKLHSKACAGETKTFECPVSEFYARNSCRCKLALMKTSFVSFESEF